jgi:hypothetical protein
MRDASAKLVLSWVYKKGWRGGLSQNGYLWNYDLYGPVRNACFWCRQILVYYEGKWDEVGPWKSRLFWYLWNCIEPLGECPLGPKPISRAHQPPPTCQSNGLWGRINHRSIGSSMYMSFCILYSVFCILYFVFCTLYSVLRILHSVYNSYTPCLYTIISANMSIMC